MTILSLIWQQIEPIIPEEGEKGEDKDDRRKQTINNGKSSQSPKPVSSAADQSTPTITTTTKANTKALDYEHYRLTFEEPIMERLRDLQREHHKRSFQHLLASQAAQAAAARRARATGSSSLEPAGNGDDQNLYDTVADALLESESDESTTNTASGYEEEEEEGSGQRDKDSSSNLESQRNEIESWLVGIEKRFTDFIAEYNPAKFQSSSEYNSAAEREELLRRQLSIITTYHSELAHYTSQLQVLSNAIDARLAMLAPKGGGHPEASTISMPYYDHLIAMRKHGDGMQIRINDLYLR